MAANMTRQIKSSRKVALLCCQHVCAMKDPCREQAKSRDSMKHAVVIRTPARIWSLIGHLVTSIWPARYRQKRYLGEGTSLRGTRIPTFEFGL